MLLAFPDCNHEKKITQTNKMVELFFRKKNKKEKRWKGKYYLIFWDRLSSEVLMEKWKHIDKEHGGGSNKKSIKGKMLHLFLSRFLFSIYFSCCMFNRVQSFELLGLAIITHCITSIYHFFIQVFSFLFLLHAHKHTHINIKSSQCLSNINS